MRWKHTISFIFCNLITLPHLLARKKSPHEEIHDRIFTGLNVNSRPSVNNWDDPSAHQNCELWLPFWTENRAEAMPCFSDNDLINVRVEIQMTRFVDVDYDNQAFTVALWINYAYLDPRLAWDLDKQDSKTGQVLEQGYYPSKIHTSPENIWLPDLTLYNSATDSIGLYDDKVHSRSDAIVTIYNSGMVYWSMPVALTASCALEARHFPFDVQICRMKFSGWATNAEEINYFLPASKGKIWKLKHNGKQYNSTNYPTRDLMILDPTAKNEDKGLPYEKEKIIDIAQVDSSSYQSGDSMLLNYKLETTPVQLKIDSEGWQVIECFFIFRRDPSKFTMNVILPCIIFGVLGIFSFYIPAESGERLGISAGILISVSVYNSYIAEIMPKTQTSVPIISKFLALLLFITMFSTLFAIMPVRIMFVQGNNYRPYKFILNICYNKFTRVLMLDSRRLRIKFLKLRGRV